MGKVKFEFTVVDKFASLFNYDLSYGYLTSQSDFILY